MAAALNPSTGGAALGYPSGITDSGSILYRESVEHGGSGPRTIEEIMDETNEPAVIVTSNAADEYTITGILKATPTVPARGAIVTLGAVKYMVLDVRVAYTRTIGRITLRVIRHGAITYT